MKNSINLKILGAFLCAIAGARAAPLLPVISDQQAGEIGKQIWRNECGGTVSGLTSWNVGEDFPSLGICHAIWYRHGQREKFLESFPLLVAYLKQHGAELPDVLIKNRHNPWPTRGQFLAARDDPDMVALRNFLHDTIGLQGRFVAGRLEQALPKILAGAPADSHAALTMRFQSVAATPRGIYALVDYVNFKGEGVREEERYHGQGWGLLQVLQEMGDTPPGAPARQEFSRAAVSVLKRRIANSPPARGDQRWLAGWEKRCLTYR
ncbi:MAG: hypothetical protein LBD30_06275 [Verrucomicrobiales bacterium]|jgi:hypothetical protein|nr:hypothetical protein [Verrucomicrobiales bacterium]